MAQKIQRKVMERLRAAAVHGHSQDFRQQIDELLKAAGPSCLVEVRRLELLLACRDPQARSAVRRAYMDALIEARVAGPLLTSQTMYVSFSEVAARLRDEIAFDAAHHGDVLRELELADAIEACAIVVASQTRRFIRVAQQIHAEYREAERHPLQSAVLFSELSHEIGGLTQLLAPMIKEAARGRGRAPHVPERGRPGCPSLAARPLLVIAEQWQALSYLRQQVATGQVHVERVEMGVEGPRILLAPDRVVDTWRRPAIERRLSNMSTPRRHTPLRLKKFPVDLQKLAGFVSRGTHGDECDEQLVEELQREIVSAVQAVDIVLVESAPEKVAHLTFALWAGQLLAYGLDLVASQRLQQDATYARRWRFTYQFAREELVHVIAGCAGVSTDCAAQALTALSSRPHDPVPMDLATRPFVALDDTTVALIRSPFGRSNVFMETRRVLASRDATSRFVGAAYEKYIRALMQAGGFHVAPGRIVLDDSGRKVTDLDVVAYKDGVAFVLQAKYLTEPDSLHAFWKARETVDNAIRQCLVARSHLQRHPDKVASMVSEPRQNVRELCCAVVTPCLRFSGECVWPVPVVDDMYLDHIQTVGTIRQKREDGEVVHERLYPGSQPTGPELRTLLMRPAHLSAFHTGGGGLQVVERKIRYVTVTEFIGRDDVRSIWQQVP